MANTYIKIGSITITSAGTASISFTSIPSTYTDLAIKASLRGISENTSYVLLNLNNSNTNLACLNLNAYTPSTVNSYGYASTALEIAGQQPYVWRSTAFSNVDYYIPNFNSSTYKSVTSDSTAGGSGSSGNNYLGFTATSWSNTAAITSVQLWAGSTQNGDTFAIGSTATLYGIKKD